LTVVENPVDQPHWRGINHLALITGDMDATVRFYHGVLGARLVATIGTPDFRHYFFEIGEANTVAFFEYANIPLTTFSKPAGVPDPRAVQFDHVSFNLADEHALHLLRKRLEAFGCEVTTIVDHQFIHSIYFTDPNGIALEASCWVDDATGRDSDPRDRALFADPDPVPAVRELVETGHLESTPSTSLVSEPSGIVDPA
jgi:catechol 2,3-dioxygenase-like lactoylglutathione lyase family enzyme